MLKILIPTTIFLFLFQSVLAQQECRHLMENLYPTTPVETMAIKSASESFISGETVEFDVERNIDLAQEEVYMKVTQNDSDLILRLVNGEASMQKSGVDLPVPPTMESMLKQAINQQGVLPNEYEVISCDGLTSYKEILAGEQVTIKTKLKPEQETEDIVHVVFLGEQIKGFYTSSSLVMIHDYKADRETNIPQSFQTEVFQVNEDETTLIGTSDFEVTSYNQSID